MTDPITRARENLDGYSRHGARYSPGAHSFTLISLDEHGEADGGSADLCRGCVATVAADARSDMDMVARGHWPGHSLSTALGSCGPAIAYDIVGNTELEYCTTCADCQGHIECSSECTECEVSGCPCRCAKLGHVPDGNLECRHCRLDLTSPDTVAIRREVEAAERQGRVVSDGCARAIAAQWYDGSLVPAYEFVSCGAIGSGLTDARRLLGVTAKFARAEDRSTLAALTCYLSSHGPRGPVEGWAEVWIRP